MGLEIKVDEDNRTTIKIDGQEFKNIAEYELKGSANTAITELTMKMIIM